MLCHGVRILLPLLLLGAAMPVQAGLVGPAEQASSECLAPCAESEAFTLSIALRADLLQEGATAASCLQEIASYAGEAPACLASVRSTRMNLYEAGESDFLLTTETTYEKLLAEGASNMCFRLVIPNEIFNGSVGNRIEAVANAAKRAVGSIDANCLESGAVIYVMTLILSEEQFFQLYAHPN